MIGMDSKNPEIKVPKITKPKVFDYMCEIFASFKKGGFLGGGGGGETPYILP